MPVSYGKFQKVEDKEFDRTVEYEDMTPFEGILLDTISKEIKGSARTFHQFETLEGERVEVWGAGVLDGRLKNVPNGNLVQITYLGKNITNKRGQAMHNFEVLHAEPAEA